MIIGYWFIILLIVEKSGLWLIMIQGWIINIDILLWYCGISQNKSWFSRSIWYGNGGWSRLWNVYLQRDSSIFLVISIHYQSMFCFLLDGTQWHKYVFFCLGHHLGLGRPCFYKFIDMFLILIITQGLNWRGVGRLTPLVPLFSP